MSLLNSALLYFHLQYFHLWLEAGLEESSPVHTSTAGTARAAPGSTPSKDMVWKQQVLLSRDKPKILQKDLWTA